MSPKPENSLAIWSYEVACRLSKLSEVIIYAKGKLKAYTEKHQDIKYK
ncbi:MAG: hypothetical protein F6K24_11405 [Okeania sp. SIO2D1]|nr:hypothetical protein [Okeania sp. SIO2D1]